MSDYDLMETEFDRKLEIQQKGAHKPGRTCPPGLLTAAIVVDGVMELARACGHTHLGKTVSPDVILGIAELMLRQHWQSAAERESQHQQKYDESA